MYYCLCYVSLHEVLHGGDEVLLRVDVILGGGHGAPNINGPSAEGFITMIEIATWVALELR